MSKPIDKMPIKWVNDPWGYTTCISRKEKVEKRCALCNGGGKTSWWHIDHNHVETCFRCDGKGSISIPKYPAIIARVSWGKPTVEMVSWSAWYDLADEHADSHFTAFSWESAKRGETESMFEAREEAIKAIKELVQRWQI